MQLSSSQIYDAFWPISSGKTRDSTAEFPQCPKALPLRRQRLAAVIGLTGTVVTVAVV